MLYPLFVQTAVVTAHEVVRQHPQHDLVLGQRRIVLNAFGPWPTPLLIHACMCLIVSRRALPRWEQVLPVDRAPHQWLALAEQAMRGQVGQPELRRHIDEAIVHGENAWYMTKEPDIRAVGQAAGRALVEASLMIRNHAQLGAPFSTDTEAARQPVDPNLTDRDIDPDGLDSSFWVASVFAQGAPWNPASDVLGRQKFWQWWLDDALSSAYQMALTNAT